MKRLVPAVALCAIALGLAAAAAASDAPAGVLFELTDASGSRFVIALTDPEKIRHARALLAGTERTRPHVSGLIVKSRATYNPRWSYHLDPGSIGFFDASIEVCDATMQYVEEHLGEVGDAFLPQGRWCPWGSQLVAEVAGNGAGRRK